MKKETFSELDRYQHLYIVAKDLGMARQYAMHLLKKAWHSQPYERRGSIYMQQSAFTTSLVISYARPFTKSFGWPSHSLEFFQYEPAEEIFHKHLMNCRNQIYAHSDSSQFSIKPWRINTDILTDIVGQPSICFSREECELVVSMVSGVIHRIRPLIENMRINLADGLKSD